MCQRRDESMIENYQNVFNNDPHYVALTKSIFLSPVIVPFDEISLPVTEMNEIYKIYIPFKLSSDLAKDDWAGIVVDMAECKLYYFDSRNVNYTSLQGGDEEPFNINFPVYLDFVNRWMISSNYEPRKPLTVGMYSEVHQQYEGQSIDNDYDSAFYMMTVFDFIYRDCPRYFKQDDMIHFRTSYCYNVLLQQLD